MRRDGATVIQFSAPIKSPSAGSRVRLAPEKSREGTRFSSPARLNCSRDTKSLDGMRISINTYIESAGARLALRDEIIEILERPGGTSIAIRIEASSSPSLVVESAVKMLPIGFPRGQQRRKRSENLLNKVARLPTPGK